MKRAQKALIITTEHPITLVCQRRGNSNYKHHDAIKQVGKGMVRSMKDVVDAVNQKWRYEYCQIVRSHNDSQCQCREVWRSVCRCLIVYYRLHNAIAQARKYRAYG